MQDNECSAGTGDLKRFVAKRQGRHNAGVSDRAAFRWTLLWVIASVPCTLLFAWVFLHVILTLVFPRAANLH